MNTNKSGKLKYWEYVLGNPKASWGTFYLLFQGINPHDKIKESTFTWE